MQKHRETNKLVDVMLIGEQKGSGVNKKLKKWDTKDAQTQKLHARQETVRSTEKETGKKKKDMGMKAAAA